MHMLRTNDWYKNEFIVVIKKCGHNPVSAIEDSSNADPCPLSHILRWGCIVIVTSMK